MKASVAKICQVLSLDRETVDVEKSLLFGTDSLVAIKLRNWIQQTLRVKVKVLEIISDATCLNLIKGMLAKVKETNSI